jgi:DNA-binding IclR family transcriptional regulator
MVVGLMSPEATRFVRGVGSVEKLELLLALARMTDRSGSIVDLARESRLPPAIARRMTTEMERAHVVEMTPRGQVRLAPRDPRDRAAVEEVLAVHARSPGTLLRLLHER